MTGVLDSLHDSDSSKRDPDGVGQLLLPRVGPRGTPCVYPVKGQGGVDDDEEVGELELFGVPYDYKQARQGKRERERERSDGVSVEDCENEARLTLSIRKRQHPHNKMKKTIETRTSHQPSAWRPCPLKPARPLTKKGHVPIIKFPNVKYGAKSMVMASTLPPEG